MATVYRVGKTGDLEVSPMKLYDTPPNFTGGGGGLTSTADDYLEVHPHADGQGRGGRGAAAEDRNR